MTSFGSSVTDWLHGAWAVFMKDLRLELRHRHALNMLLLFVLGTVLTVLFGVGQQPTGPRVQAALLWVVILFSAALGLGRSFLAEEEGGTVLLLQLNLRPSMVYAGKLAFNVLLIFALNLVAVAAFLLLAGAGVGHAALLLATLALGALGLAGATTLLAALIARTTRQAPLLPVLLFPLLAPLLLSAVSATRKALDGAAWAAAGEELLGLVGFAGVTITASVLLFDYIWTD